MIAVVAVDDHPMMLRGLAGYLSEHDPDLVLRAVYPRVSDMLASGEDPPDVVLLDIQLPDDGPVAANVSRIRAVGAQVVLYTAEGRAGIVRQALDAGALALVLKGDPEERLVEAVQAAARGQHYASSRLAHAIVTDPLAAVRLSAQEREVLTLAAKGYPRRLIAKTMNISETTLPTYLTRAMRRYAEAGREPAGTGDLIAQALRYGHIELADERRTSDPPRP